MDKKLQYALIYAFESGNMEMFRLLTKDFNSMEKKDSDEIAFFTAAHAPGPDYIQHLLDLGFDVNTRNENGAGLLHFAVTSPSAENVRFLLAKGLDLEAKTRRGDTPLMVAAAEARTPEMLEALMKAGADISVRNNGGETLLIHAAGLNPNPEITEFLLKKGFDPEDRDNDGFTAIINAAAWQSNVEVLNVLEDAGADTKAKTKDGENLLHVVSHNTSGLVADHISNLFSTSDLNDRGESCLQEMLTRGASPEVMKSMLRKMKVEQMMYACSNSNPEIVEALIQSGYDPNSSDEHDKTAMMMAAKVNDNPDVIMTLFCYKASCDCHDWGSRNCLHYAAANPNPAIYEWMKDDDDFRKLAGEKDFNGNLPEYYREHPDEFQFL